jgi:hypothetical protein
MDSHQDLPVTNQVNDLLARALTVSATEKGDVVLAVAKLERELAEERALLDLLDREANDEPIVLHSLVTPRFRDGYRGIGLKCTGRTLREALKQWVAAGIGAVAQEPPK